MVSPTRNRLVFPLTDPAKKDDVAGEQSFKMSEQNLEKSELNKTGSSHKIFDSEVPPPTPIFYPAEASAELAADQYESFIFTINPHSYLNRHGDQPKNT